MWDRLKNHWLPRLFFLATMAVALAIAGAVLVSPWLLPDSAPPQLLELFAQDVTVRRTAIASAAALIVTAFVFFRPASASKKASQKKPASDNMAGA